MRVPLPIDAQLAAIACAVKTHGGAVVVAEPGAGKTTRVPSMLLDAMGIPIVCTQPRRIAARLSAKRVAEERGTKLGGEIGYEVRFDRKVSANTRLRFMTEGLALRQWKSLTKGPQVLVLDEFHERHLDADMLLALVAKERRCGGSLGLVVMSATLDADPISEFLGGLPVVASKGRQFPVEMESVPPRDQEYLEVSISRALREILKDEKDTGDVLVFLPGISEIRRAQEKLAPLAKERGLLLLPLHGTLSRKEQDLAIAPASGRKVVLATNVAETSLTIDGVTSVIDSGTARVSRHSPWTGLASLHVEPISQASAKQRAGRAGRTRPGRCLRLYSEHELKGRREFDAPEIVRSDLAAPSLQLAAAASSMSEIRWLDAPPQNAQEAANELLTRLGAIEGDGTITEVGKRMSTLAVHPRLARLILEGAQRGLAKTSARAAALLSERPLRHSQRRGEQAQATSTSDVLDDLEVLAKVESGGFRINVARAAGVDIQTAKNVCKNATQWLRALSAQRDAADLSHEERDEALQLALLAGFPDRAARRVRERGESLLLCQGGAVTQSRSSAVLDAEYLLAIDLESRGNRSLVRTASQIDPTWLLDLPGVHDVDEHSYESAGERVVRRTGIFYGDIAIDEERIVDPSRLDEDRAKAILRDALLDGKLEQVADMKELSAYRLRHEFAAKHAPELSWRVLDSEMVSSALLSMCARPTRLADLRGVSVVEAVHWALSPDERGAMEKLAPTHVSIPARKRVEVNYEVDRPPWIQSRLQDFFGAQAGPSVAAGKVPLVLHLLAPNRRAVQVTTDLAGFWLRHYPDLRRQLMRRYPRHKWPEKP
ncbi:MAG: ATP-dependent helicase HrpB [Myxococcales bacterium]|nr:ATP-dependent helicase HrpB [Myxococcales bacterium]